MASSVTRYRNAISSPRRWTAKWSGGAVESHHMVWSERTDSWEHGNPSCVLRRIFPIKAPVKRSKS